MSSKILRSIPIFVVLFFVLSLKIESISVNGDSKKIYVTIDTSGCQNTVFVRVCGKTSPSSSGGCITKYIYPSEDLVIIEFSVNFNIITKISATCTYSQTTSKTIGTCNQCLGMECPDYTTSSSKCNEKCISEDYDWGELHCSSCRWCPKGPSPKAFGGYNCIILENGICSCTCYKTETNTLSDSINTNVILDRNLCYQNGLTYLEGSSSNFNYGDVSVYLKNTCLFFDNKVPGKDFEAGGDSNPKVSYVAKDEKFFVTFKIENYYYKKTHGTGWWEGDAISGFSCVSGCEVKENTPNFPSEKEDVVFQCFTSSNKCIVLETNQQISWTGGCEELCKEIGYDSGETIGVTRKCVQWLAISLQPQQCTDYTYTYKCKCINYGKDYGCCYPSECWDGTSCVPHKTEKDNWVCWYGSWYIKTNCYDATGVLCTGGEKYIVEGNCKSSLTSSDVGKQCYREEETCVEGVVTYDNWSSKYGTKGYECSPGCFFNNKEYNQNDVITIKYDPNGNIQYYNGEIVYHSYVCYNHFWRDPDEKKEYCEMVPGAGWTGSYCCGDDSNETWVCIGGKCSCVSKGKCNATLLPFWNDSNYYVYPRKNEYLAGEFFYLCEKESDNPIYCKRITLFYCEGVENCPDKAGFCYYNVSLENVTINDNNPCDPTWEKGFRIEGVNGTYPGSILVNGSAKVGSVIEGENLYYLPISGDYFSREVYIGGFFNYTQLNIINNECVGNDPGERFIVRYCQGKPGYTCSTDFSDIIKVDKNKYDRGYCVYNGEIYPNGNITYDRLYHIKKECILDKEPSNLYAYYYYCKFPVYRASFQSNYYNASLTTEEQEDGTIKAIYEEWRNVPLVCINGTLYGSCGDGKCDSWENPENCPEDCCSSDCTYNGAYTTLCVGYNGCSTPPECEQNPLARFCLDNETLLTCTQMGAPSVVSCKDYGIEEAMLKALQYSVYSPLVIFKVEEYLKKANLTAKCSVDHCEVSDFELDGDKNPIICHAFSGEMFYDPILKKNICCGDDVGENVVEESFIDLMGRIDVERRKVCSISVGGLPTSCLLVVSGNKYLTIPQGESIEIFTKNVPSGCSISKIYKIFLDYYLERKGDIKKILDEISKCVNFSFFSQILYESMEKCKEGTISGCIVEMGINYSPEYVESNYNQHYVTYSVKIGGKEYDFDKMDNLFFSVTALTPGKYVCRNGVFVLEEPNLSISAGNVTYESVGVPLKLTFGWRNITTFKESNVIYRTVLRNFLLNYSQKEILTYEKVLQKGESR